MPKLRRFSMVKVKAGVYRTISLSPVVVGSPVALPSDFTLPKEADGIWLGKVPDSPSLHIVAVGIGENETVDIQVPLEAYIISS